MTRQPRRRSQKTAVDKARSEDKLTIDQLKEQLENLRSQLDERGRRRFIQAKLGEFAVNGTNMLARASEELTPEYQLPTDREIEDWKVRLIAYVDGALGKSH
jgi:hypothetical protein